MSRANNSHGQVITRRSFLGSAGALIGGLPLLGYSQNQRRAPQPLRATYLEAQYLPVLRLHPDDPYRPSTVSWLLPRAELRFKGHADPILKKGEVSPYNIHTRVFGGQTSGGGNRVTDFYLNYPDDSDRETTRRGNLDEFACYVHISRQEPFRDTIAQQQSPSTAVPTPAPTISKEYVSADGRFKILFPAAPNEIHETVETSMGKLPFHMLICPFTPTVSYHVVYMDYPINLESADLVKKALDSAREGSLKRIAKEDPQVTKESDISIDGHAGRYLEIELKGDAKTRMRYFVVENRVYVIGLGSPKEKPKVLDATNDYEAIATRFMDSFKITPALQADMSTTWKEFSSTEGGFKVQFPGTLNNPRSRLDLQGSCT